MRKGCGDMRGGRQGGPRREGDLGGGGGRGWCTALRCAVLYTAPCVSRTMEDVKGVREEGEAGGGGERAGEADGGTVGGRKEAQGRRAGAAREGSGRGGEGRERAGGEMAVVVGKMEEEGRLGRQRQ